MYYGGESSKGSWIPFVVLIILLMGGLAYVLFGSLLFGPNVRQPVQPSPGCVAVGDVGYSSDRIDVVFLPDNYADIEKFREATSEMVDVFLQTKPYDESVQKFNFFRVEDLDLTLNCNYKYGGDAIVCDPSSIKKASVICPHDYPAVIVDVKGVQKFYELLRSSSWMGTMSLNSDDDPLVFAHEFAHAFANFADEYEYGGRITWDAPNCDPSWRDCPKFKVVEDSECIQGCVNNEHSRSIKTGIMRDYWRSKVYGSYNEYILSNLIVDVTGVDSIEVIQKSMPIYQVEVRFLNGAWEIIDIVESEGYPDDVNLGDTSSNYISLLDGEGVMLSSLSLPITTLFVDGLDAEGNPSPDVFLETGSFIVNLPKVDEADKIVVEQEGIIRSSVEVQSGGGFSSINSQEVEIPETYSS